MEVRERGTKVLVGIPAGIAIHRVYELTYLASIFSTDNLVLCHAPTPSMLIAQDTQAFSVMS